MNTAVYRTVWRGRVCLLVKVGYDRHRAWSSIPYDAEGSWGYCFRSEHLQP